MRGPLVRGVGGVLRSMLTRSSDKTAFLLEWRNSQHRPKQHPDRGLLPPTRRVKGQPARGPGGQDFRVLQPPLRPPVAWTSTDKELSKPGSESGHANPSKRLRVGQCQNGKPTDAPSSTKARERRGPRVRGSLGWTGASVQNRE